MIPPSSHAPSSSNAIWSGTTHIKASSESMRMVLLTASLIGIQFTWGIEMTYCTPYLLNLGLTKSHVSLVWIAGPLSGLVMQPIIGILADASTSPWGRRRPYMVVGTIVVAACLLLLGWTAEVVAHLMPSASVNIRREATIALAVVAIYGVDFAVNAVQACSRSLIVDSLPSNKQQSGSAWASRMVAVGHLVGYAIGAVDLTGVFGTALGDSQFKQLTIISALALILCVSVTCWAVQERVLVSRRRTSSEKDDKGGIVAMVMQIVRTTQNLPARISAICWITFWCWIGWFPFLFYSTTWIGEVYLRYNAPPEARDHPDSLGQVGRMGSMTLIIFSLVTFVASVLLPWVVQSPEEEAGGIGEFTPRPPESIAGVLLALQKYKPTLLSAWGYSIVIFGASMICAPFVTSMRAATTIVALCGIPWAMQCWAPFTFLGQEINRLSTTTHPLTGAPKRRDSSDLTHAQKDALYSDLEKHAAADPAPGSDLAGVYLGILNLYSTVPQFIGTVISWTVFSLLEPGKSPELAKHAHPDEHHGTDGPNAIAVCLFIGALAAVMAARETRRLEG
ncbi:MFS general substrate transporter [Microthyrium microscopicum]|uniref:MFS general substrate transporter n=1 Tax=Microthyrium microscopicum TaxID=703497 RepID=A0A6A6UBL2_9PEZI|nr:MFS general substrate transporter [Microthyrium microscopicum]